MTGLAGHLPLLPVSVAGTAAFLHKRPELELEKIKNALRVLSFIWTMSNVEMIVGALNKPEIRDLVEEVVTKRGTPAYDVIGYFLRLDTGG